MIQALEDCGAKTPPGSIIWASWGHGYPLMYWGRRATISDGTYHSGELAAILGFPYACKDERQAANWIHFYASRGLKGFHRVYKTAGSVALGWRFIQRVMKAGPKTARALLSRQGFKPLEDWVRFFFPPQDKRRPVYLLTDAYLTRLTFWWYWYGTWYPDAHSGKHPFIRRFTSIVQSEAGLKGPGAFRLDIDKGILQTRDDHYQLSMLTTVLEKTAQNKWYRNKGLVFEYDAVSKTGILCTPHFYNSIFNRLFFLRALTGPYFHPEIIQYPVFYLWKVTGQASNG